MTDPVDRLDDAIRVALADITAAAPQTLAAVRSGDAQVRRPVWLLPVVAAATIALVAGLAVLATRDRSTPSAEQAPVQVPAIAERFPTVAARVTSSEVASGGTTVEIDHGASDGIQVGMAVLDHEGMVGKVTRVDDTSSVVLLVTDPAYAIECVADGVPGECMGAGLNAPMEFVSESPVIAQPSHVTTRGGPLSTAPPDILIGALTGAAIDVVADLDELTAVFVVRYVPASVPVDAGD